jgi:predicted acylesterase/phospholipase RssA
MQDTGTNSSARDRHLFDPGPKRILAIDGGGVRGVISLTFLARIEALLRVRMGNAELRLCDYFDLIGGTSTGAIIATGLALGLPVERMIDIYTSLAQDGFQKSNWMAMGGIISPKFRAAALAKAIEKQVGAETLGSDRLRTGVAIVAKRIDTESVWVFHNNPKGRFYADQGRDGKGIPNKDMKLLNLIRASTAAPSYFEPQVIEVARDERTGSLVRGAFIDGGVSPHNNPALLLYMLATISGYGFNWKTGADNLMLVSVGNGAAGDAPAQEQASRITSAQLAIKSLLSMMRDCSKLNQAMLQWMSRCPTRWMLDTEIEDLANDRIAERELLHYMRYDVELEAAALAELGLTFGSGELAEIREFDRPELVSVWLDIGRHAADKQVRDKHFPGSFDLAGHRA